MTENYGKKGMSVRTLADELNLWRQVVAAIETRSAAVSSRQLLEKLAAIPVTPSRAGKRLGCYAYRGSEPVVIRLQFAQEEDNLRQTFLHEIAHACDHLSQHGGRRQVAHGSSWRQWALALGIDTATTGCSPAVVALYQQRRKLVAVCLECGAEIYRVRRLNRTNRYLHPPCGGILKPL
ncbi:SprT-like domain-containing protein [Pelovirga terrestris]|uniref:SprT-like domain-containing protein n=1 Tax=Pelovirga terrestris TaxID=2771352 RepID=A0A8J6UR42_9BACT|nr:SprT-like domain-containing protein [Pelovirga terrestris]MBD1400546.1 SprT-like domain-containing protein [Pelovirga terrestris]